MFNCAAREAVMGARLPLVFEAKVVALPLLLALLLLLVVLLEISGA